MQQREPLSAPPAAEGEAPAIGAGSPRRVTVANVVQADEGTPVRWRSWDGGRWPYTGDEMIYLKLRCGWETQGPRRAALFRWSHKGEPGDIVAWREGA